EALFFFFINRADQWNKDWEELRRERSPRRSFSRNFFQIRRFFFITSSLALRSVFGHKPLKERNFLRPTPPFSTVHFILNLPPLFPPFSFFYTGLPFFHLFFVFFKIFCYISF